MFARASKMAPPRSLVSSTFAPPPPPKKKRNRQLHSGCPGVSNTERLENKYLCSITIFKYPNYREDIVNNLQIHVLIALCLLIRLASCIGMKEHLLLCVHIVLSSCFSFLYLSSRDPNKSFLVLIYTTVLPN